ncbi:FAS1-like dehydratase domain-containing protein [Natronomonas salsuginis]|uniref:Dehydratase n=1 Tax=Natronomonas salsuginis TaxID=2217661 RepID=A0A4U5JCX1_9EURY|nr:MaoC family dehydratase N-terminal domain-containing protein [Natronomonas salsuginis]TKR25447.1 dehydratase [Natronomonas salsuginis]
MPTDRSDERADIPAEGDVITHERTFTVEHVREFGEITGDQQSIHTDPDADGRLIVQELLTGSLMTKIGGHLRYIAQTMTYEFRRPVFTGETVTCEWTVESVAEREDRYLLENDVVYRNEDDKTVVDASTSGLIWKDET